MMEMILEKPAVATKDIYVGVCRCIEKSTGLESDQIQADKTLVEDLKIDSIDMMDLLYEIEDEFNISVKIGEFEREARIMAGETPFAVDNVITPEGVAILQKLMPEVPHEKFKPGLLVQQIPYLFTVRSICHLVERKLKPTT